MRSARVTSTLLFFLEPRRVKEGIGFPVPYARALLHHFGALIYADAVFDMSPVRGRSVAFSALPPAANDSGLLARGQGAQRAYVQDVAGAVARGVGGAGDSGDGGSKRISVGELCG